MQSSKLLTVAILAAGLTLAPSVRAENRVDITPSIAFVTPQSDAVEEMGATAKFDNSVGFGGRLSIWLNERVVLEGSGHYGRSALTGEAFGESASIDVDVFYGSVQVAVGLGEAKRFMIHAGLGVQGTNYDSTIEGGNQMTGVFGISGWMPLGETVALRTDLDVHAFSLYYEVDGTRTQEIMQYDVVFSVGLQLSPAGR